MAQIVVRTTHASAKELTENDLDAIRDSYETFANITLHSDDNIQDAGITASSKVVAGTVTQAKIAPSAATAAKLASSSVTTAKIADENITTAKIADANVTDAKLADFNYGISDDIAYSTTSTSDTVVATVSITTAGRPVKVSLFPGSLALDGFAGITMSTSSTSSINPTDAIFTLKRDSTRVGGSRLGLSTPKNTMAFQAPATLVSFYDEPAAGTYTYTLYARTLVAATTLQILARLVAYEL